MAKNALVDIKTERTLLGFIISNPDQSKAALESLNIEDFGDNRHQAIFQTVRRIYNTFLEKNLNEEFSFDTALLLAELKADKNDEIAGGDSYLYDLKMQASDSEKIESYVIIIKNLALIRHLFETTKGLEKDFVQQPIDYSEFLGHFEDQIVKITEQREVTEFVNIKDAISRMKIYYSKPDLTISSGYSSLDMIIRGFQPGNLIILAARPSVGKTALAINFLLNVASANRSAAIFSLEMSQEQLIMRMLENLGRLNEGLIRKYLAGKINPSSPEGADIAASFEAGLEKLSRKNIFFDDHSSSSIGEIQAKARRLKASYSNLSLIVIDYIGLINSPSRSKDFNRQQEVATISRNLKALARDLQVPVIALCQLSREVDSRKDHKPVLSDLRDSGAIEQDADQVYTLYRSDYYQDQQDKENSNDSAYPNAPSDIPTPDANSDNSFSEVILNVQKNRTGKTGEVNLGFNKEYCRFDDMGMDEGYSGN